MPLKGLIFVGFIIVIIFLLIDHRRIHGRFIQVEDFRDAIFNSVKSHEGIIFIIVIFMIGCLTGMVLSHV